MYVKSRTEGVAVESNIGWYILIGIGLFLAMVQTLRLKFLKKYFEEERSTIRTEAIKQSKSVTRGQLSEQLLPLLPDFKYNPSDCKFVGQPIDYIIYSGMSNARDSGEGEITVIFAEIKQGKSSRTKIQNRIKKAIEAGRVKFETIKLDYENKIIKTDNAE